MIRKQAHEDERITESSTAAQFLFATFNLMRRESFFIDEDGNQGDFSPHILISSVSNNSQSSEGIKKKQMIIERNLELGITSSFLEEANDNRKKLGTWYSSSFFLFIHQINKGKQWTDACEIKMAPKTNSGDTKRRRDARRLDHDTIQHWQLLLFDIITSRAG
jgi:hypothetical protein